MWSDDEIFFFTISVWSTKGALCAHPNKTFLGLYCRSEASERFCVRTNYIFAVYTYKHNNTVNSSKQAVIRDLSVQWQFLNDLEHILVWCLSANIYTNTDVHDVTNLCVCYQVWLVSRRKEVATSVYVSCSWQRQEIFSTRSSNPSSRTPRLCPRQLRMNLCLHKQPENRHKHQILSWWHQKRRATMA